MWHIYDFVKLYKISVSAMFVIWNSIYFRGTKLFVYYNLQLPLCCWNYSYHLLFLFGFILPFRFKGLFEYLYNSNEILFRCK